jgi:hypothetical protein
MLCGTWHSLHVSCMLLPFVGQRTGYSVHWRLQSIGLVGIAAIVELRCI